MTYTVDAFGRDAAGTQITGFTAGVTAYLPVFMPGALLFMGDGHAVQGDGEVGGTGLEVSIEVDFRVDLIKNKHINWPRGENQGDIFTVGNARPQPSWLN